ncbi:hypothetical protein ACA081_00855, partial [Candidatus Hodgkinia cicadicola]
TQNIYTMSYLELHKSYPYLYILISRIRYLFAIYFIPMLGINSKNKPHAPSSLEPIKLNKSLVITLHLNP